MHACMHDERTRDAERPLAAGLEHAQEGGQSGDLLEVVHEHQHAHVVGALHQLYVLGVGGDFQVKVRYLVGWVHHARSGSLTD